MQKFVFFRRLKSEGLTARKTPTEKVVFSEFAPDLDFIVNDSIATLALLSTAPVRKHLLLKSGKLKIDVE